MSIKRYIVNGSYGMTPEDETYEHGQPLWVRNSDYNKIQSQLTALTSQLESVVAENAALKTSVENAAGCITAAYAEGLLDALAESEDARLVDLVERRLLLSYLQVETPVTNEILASMGDHVLLEQLEDSRKFIGTQSEIIANQEQRISEVTAENATRKSEVPLGAIENGRAFADRLEAYPFESQGGNLSMCSDWQELIRCFEHLADWAMHGQEETPATSAFLAEVRASGVEMYADNLDSSADDSERDGFDDAVKFLRSEASGVRLFAAQLRQGGAV